MSEANQLFVSNRDINVGTVYGHSVFFKKGVPQTAPRVIHHVLIERGIFPVDENGEVQTEKAADLAEAPSVAFKMAPEDAFERSDAIVKAMKMIIKRNNSKDFSANTPSAQAVSDIVGWRVDQKETRSVWEKNRAMLLGQVKE